MSWSRAEGHAVHAMLPLLLLAIASIQSAAALTCYDCLSIALPECLQSSLKSEFDKIHCKSDEKFCAVLQLTDSNGQAVVARQCASRPDEGEQLKNYIEGTQQRPMTLVRFRACKGDLCNVEAVSGGGAPPAAPRALLTLLLSLAVALAATADVSRL